MQTQDAPAEFLFKLWPKLEQNWKTFAWVAGILIAIGGILYYVSAQKEQQQVDAGQALTAIMVNPVANSDINQLASNFEQLAAKYPDTVAGKRAQLQAGAALFASGKYPEAQAQFEKLLTMDANGSLAPTAELGVAASLEAQNKLDDAAAKYKLVTTVFGDTACIQQAEFALGRLAQQQNKLLDAKSHYDNAAHASLRSSVSEEAAQRSAEIKAKLDAAAPKPAATSATPATPAVKK